MAKQITRDTGTPKRQTRKTVVPRDAATGRFITITTGTVVSPRFERAVRRTIETNREALRELAKY